MLIIIFFLFNDLFGFSVDISKLAIISSQFGFKVLTIFSVCKFVVLKVPQYSFFDLCLRTRLRTRESDKEKEKGKEKEKENAKRSFENGKNIFNLKFFLIFDSKFFLSLKG